MLRKFTYILVLFIAVLLNSCNNGNNVISTDSVAINEFKVKVCDEWIDCIIDNENNKISIPNIENGDVINEVQYVLSDGSILYPEPETFIGDWDENENILLLCNNIKKVYNLILSDYLPHYVTVYNEPKQELFLGVDAERLWYWRPSLKNQLADLAVGELKSSYVRVAICCDYEREEGNINEAAYDNVLEVMTEMKRINPDIKFFASPQPLKEAYSEEDMPAEWNGEVPWSPYPTWVLPVKKVNGKYETDDNKLNIDNLARYYTDYLKFMNNKGFVISYMDVTNEKNVITPAQNKQLYVKMQEKLSGTGIQMPKIIVPSAWNIQQSITWMNSVIDDNVDFFDIVSTHNTGDGGTCENFINKAKNLNKIPWNTELHNWVGIETEEEVLTSKVLWEYLRAGFVGIDTWLFYGPLEGKDHTMIWSSSTEVKKSAKYEIYKNLVNYSNGGRYYRIDDIDNKNTITNSFIKDNVLSIWVLNYGDETYKDIFFKVDEFEIQSDLSCIIWNADNEKKGKKLEFNSLDNSTFKYDIMPKTLYFFKVNLK